MDKLQRILEKYNTMTLATVGENGACAAAVFYAFSEKENAMIFLSSPKSEHILNLESNNRCAATLQENGLGWEMIKGIQIKGNVKLASEKYWNLYYEKYPFVETDEKLKPYLERVKLYMLKIKWVRIIDNKTGLGKNEEINYD
ncbi:MAG: pyridoxamine 5'-phosphate oxidase family protein [Candidatus Poseidoniales archaeon]